MTEVSTASRATAAIAVAVAAAASARAVSSSAASASSVSSTSTIISSSGAPLAAALVASVLALTAVRLLFEFAEWARCFYYLGKVRDFSFLFFSRRELAFRAVALSKENGESSSLSLPLLLSLSSFFFNPPLRSLSPFSSPSLQNNHSTQKNKTDRSRTRRAGSSAATSSRCWRPTTTAL